MGLATPQASTYGKQGPLRESGEEREKAFETEAVGVWAPERLGGMAGNTKWKGLKCLGLGEGGALFPSALNPARPWLSEG